MDHMIFDFVEDTELSSESSCDCGDLYENCDETEDDRLSDDREEKRSFWESQEQLLTECLFRSSRIESRIRVATKEMVEEIRSAGTDVCRCEGGWTTAIDGCRRCLQKEISERLQHAGYDCGVCKANWMNMKQIPAGEHTYIEVLDISNHKKGVTRIVIELNFRTEFEIGKGSREYNHLITRLPEIYIGKTERLESLIKILCAASKRCMRDQKMHIAPWRKLKYMIAKWHGERESKSVLTTNALSIVDRSDCLSRPMVSLLSIDLVDRF